MMDDILKELIYRIGATGFPGGLQYESDHNRFIANAISFKGDYKLIWDPIETDHIRRVLSGELAVIPAPMCVQKDGHFVWQHPSLQWEGIVKPENAL